MKPRLQPSILPQCSSCARSYLDAGFAGWRPFSFQQKRGVKSARNQPDVIPVQLLKHLDGFGKKGTYVPISVGQMRNRWFPRHVARYAVGDEVRAIKEGKIHVERDSEFKAGVYLHQLKLEQRRNVKKVVEIAEKEARQVQRATVAKRPTEVLTPQRAIDLLHVLLPAKMEFFRTAIEKADQEQKKSSIPKEVAAILSTANTGPIPIYGSVSTSDIAINIKELVAYNDEAARVPLSDEDIRFIGLSELEEPTRVKHLGDYEIEISIKGTQDRVRRRMQVLAQRPEVYEEGEQKTGDK